MRRLFRLTPFQKAVLDLLLLILVIVILFCFFCISQGYSQTPSQIAITGHVGDPGNIIQGSSIEFQLANCGANQPRVFGYFGYIPTVKYFTPDPTTGLISGSIWPNDVLNCGGTTGQTIYNVSFNINNVPQGPPVCYQLSSTANPFNLDSATPCNATPGPPGPTPPIDVAYHNLTLTGFLAGVAGRFSGQLELGSILLDNPPSPCPTGQFLTALSGSLASTCGTPPYPAIPVTSVFGRTADVVAQSGDYNCAQVTGCPSGAITGLTGAVSASGPGIATATLSATGATAGSYTNPNLTIGSDGRITSISNGASGPTRTCNANGCYIQYADGSIEAWGVTNTTPGSGTIAALTATFPTSFTTTSNLVLTVSPVGQGIGDGSPHPVECHVDSFSTSGATVYLSIPVQVTGSGYSHLSNTQYCNWHATGF